MTETALIEKLDALIAALKRPAIPADRLLWDSEQAAVYLGYSTNHFTQFIACKPDFPRAFQLAEKKGGLRWKAEEVMDWAESRREKRAA
jgi:predicted DNA-binding transcriptional regulator AlpA